MNPATDPSVPSGELHSLIANALAHHLPAEPLTSQDAQRAAWWILEAEFLGLPQFGISMLLRELGRLGPSHGDAPVAAPPSRLRIDARSIPGHLAMAGAVRLAAAGAAAAGSGIVALGDVGALGVLGSPARTLAQAGLVGLVLANSAPIVAPWGGSGRALGTNPIAVAAPRAGLPPLVVDYATSPTTVAALRAARDHGEDLPEPGGFDADGRAVRDADVCARLGLDWETAGGHLPARFDALPTDPAQAPPMLSVPRASITALEKAAEGSAS